MLLVADRYQRAKKDHTCWHCQGTVKPGQVYRVRFTSEREASYYPRATIKTCLRCDTKPDRVALKQALRRGRYTHKAKDPA